jgi:hypothetical protein
MLTRSFDKRYAILKNGNLEVWCDTKQGGAPLWWFYKGFSLVNSFPGSGAQVAYEFGQDGTQATHNGPDANPIARMPQDSSMVWNYYARETEFNPLGSYRVVGFYPCFWLSHERPDDAIPPHSAGGHGWLTLYTNPNLLPYFSGPGTPIQFVPRGQVLSGIMLLGNEMKPVTESWENRYASFPNGRIAMSATISLKDANASSFAGFVFRKFVPVFATNQDQVWSADGYTLLVNRNGEVLLYRFLNNAQILVGSKRLSVMQRYYLRSTRGIKLEVRTHNILSGLIEVWVNDAQFYQYTDPDPILGDAAGIVASTSTGNIVFRDRRVFNLTYESAIRLTCLTQDRIRIDHEMLLAGGVQEGIKLYRCGFQFFLDQNTFRADRHTWVETPLGTRVEHEGIYTLSDTKAGFAGNHTMGFYIRPFGLSVNHQPATGAHALLQRHSFNDEFVFHFNWLPFSANETSVLVRSAKATLEVTPYIPS